VSAKPECKKCNELAILLLECRDALPAISLVSAKLRGVKLDLADRIEDALEPWRIVEEPEPAGSRDRDEWRHEAAEQQRLK
jgi:hypothetical protein